MKQFPRWTIVLSKALLACAVAATLVAAFYEEEDLRGDAAWKRFAGERAEAGTPLDFKYYQPPPVPDADNLMKAPVIGKMNEEMSGRTGPWQEIQRKDHEFWAFWRFNGRWHEGVPVDYPQVFSVLRKQNAATGQYPGEKRTAQLIMDFIAPVGTQLDEFVKEAANRKWSVADFPNSGPQPYLFQMSRTLSSVLAWRESAEIALGDAQASYVDIHASLRIVEANMVNPLPFRLLYAGSSGYFDLEPVWEGCARHTWNEEQLASLEKQLSQFRPLRLLPRAINANTAHMAPGPKVLPGWMPEGWAEFNLIDYAETNAASDLRSFDPKAGHVNLDEIRRAREMIAALQGIHSPYRQLSKNYWFPHLVENIAKQQCGYVLAETACALERARLATGAYPAVLSDLVPKYMVAVPTDVVDGNPLRYHADADGRYTLYSIGLNGIDDHGVYAKSTRNVSYLSWSTTEGDWVWPKLEPGNPSPSPGA
ncbi:MAG TPA: hypothetical protein VFE25_05035 [Opitutaceae bacterium]|nr:hypothetical protein [Opitutaceae bacterium]